MNFKKIVLAISLLFYVTISNAQQVTAPKFGKGLLQIEGADNSWSMNLSGRMQFLSTSNWITDSNESTDFETSFLVRRARLKFNGFAFTPKLKYKLELGLSSNDIGGASEFTGNAPRYILDAVVKWNFYKKFVLWVGQTKLPGNRERVVSSGDLQLVDRSMLNSLFNIDRDLGLQLRHQFNLSDTFIIKESFAISQGEGRNVNKGNLGGYQYTGRVELFPFGAFSQKKGAYKGSAITRAETNKLAVGFTFDYNDNAVKNRSNQGTYMENDLGFFETDVSTIFVDAMYKHKGFSFMGEYAFRSSSDEIATNSDGSNVLDSSGNPLLVKVGNGLNMQGGYLFANNWELTGRYTNTVMDNEFTTKEKSNQYTLGVSKYIVGHKLKVQSDISYLDRSFDSNSMMYRLQLDVHF